MADAVAHTIGVEEEFHVVDLDTRWVVPGAAAVLDEVWRAGALSEAQVKPELRDCMVETNGAVCSTLDELRADLVAMRREVSRAAQVIGLAVVPVGTAPLVDLDVVGLSPGLRNTRMQQDYQQLVREQVICGQHTHVYVGDPDLAYAALPRIGPWLPVLLALSASSPFWLGTDTGYASWRSMVWRRWPTSGPAPQADTAAEQQLLVDALVRTGVVADLRMLYFDARFAPAFGTIEIRVGDSCPRVDDSVLLAGLARALTATACAEIRAGTPPRHVPREVVEAGRWPACRFGLSALLVDPMLGEPRPAHEVVFGLIETVRPALEAEGDLEQVQELAERALATGGSAARQRRALARRGELTDVVDALIAETTSATDHEWEAQHVGG